MEVVKQRAMQPTLPLDLLVCYLICFLLNLVCFGDIFIDQHCPTTSYLTASLTRISVLVYLLHWDWRVFLTHCLTQALKISIYWGRYRKCISLVQISLQKAILMIYIFDIFFWILNGYLTIKMLEMELLIFFQMLDLLTCLHHHSATCLTLKPVDYSQHNN